MSNFTGNTRNTETQNDITTYRLNQKIVQKPYFTIQYDK